MRFLKSLEDRRLLILVLVAGVAVMLLVLYGGGETSVVVTFFRELGEALIGCSILMRTNPDREPAIRRGAVGGVLVGIVSAVILRAGNSWIESRWHSFAGVLAIAMPFLLLGFAAWHLLPGMLHHQLFPRIKGLKWLSSLGVGVTAFLLVWRESAEFALLSLNQGTVKVLIGAVIGGGLMVVAWQLIGRRVTRYVSYMNLLLIVVGLVLILNAGEAFVEDAHWSSGALHLWQIVYVVLGVMVFLLWLPHRREARIPSELRTNKI